MDNSFDYNMEDSIEIPPRWLLENGENLNRTDTDGVVTRFFRSCMDTAEMERQQYKPLFGALKDLNVSLPMLESLADHDTPDLDLTAYATYVVPFYVCKVDYIL